MEGSDNWPDWTDWQKNNAKGVGDREVIAERWVRWRICQRLSNSHKHKEIVY